MEEAVETIDKILKVPEQNSIKNLDFSMLSDFLSDTFLLKFDMKENKDWVAEEFRVEFQKLKEMLTAYKEQKSVTSSFIVDMFTSFQKLQFLKNIYGEENIVFGVTEFRDLMAEA